MSEEVYNIPDVVFKNVVMKMLIEMKADHTLILHYVGKLMKGDKSLTSEELEWFSEKMKTKILTEQENLLALYCGQFPDGILPPGISKPED